MHDLLGQDEDSKDKLKLSAYKYLSLNTLSTLFVFPRWSVSFILFKRVRSIGCPNQPTHLSMQQKEFRQGLLPQKVWVSQFIRIRSVDHKWA